MILVVDFRQPELASPLLVGGKGKNLIELAAAGFPVPPGFVVSAEAYRLFLSEAAWLGDELATFPYADPVRLRGRCAAIRARLGQVPLPAEVAEAIGAALEPLGGREGEPFAVRSSSTLEDLAQAAFAGQHDSYLNIKGIEAVLARVRDCFVSLWGDRAVVYRHHQGFAQDEASMAVVVQRQIACERAGVGFSIDPVSGRLDRLVIDANYGLGESVVSGESEVDHFVLDKRTLEGVGRSIGHKDRIVVVANQGTTDRELPAWQADTPCLDDHQLSLVANLLKRVEGHFGWPQDIEWGFHGGHLYLFQSRAVTTLQPNYTRDESAERFPNPMSPLTWDFLSAVFRHSLTSSLAMMGLPPLKDDWFSLHDFYVYGNQNAVALLGAYRPLRARSIPELVAEVPQLRQKYAWVLDLPVRWARDLDRYLIRLGRLSSRPLEALSVPELWSHALEIQAVATDYFAPNIAISITQSFLHRLLLHLVGLATGPDRALAIFDGLMAGCETKTAVVNRELHELAGIVARMPDLRRELLEAGARATWQDGRLASEYPAFAARLARFLEDHGHRELDMDYREPTWSGRPWIVLETITLILRQPTVADPEATSRELRVHHAETELAFLGSIPSELRFFFRELIRLARTYTTLDDLEHYQTTRINPVARDAALEIGRRCVDARVLDAPEDVFLFRKSELERLVAEYPPSDPVPYRAIIDTTRRAFQAAFENSPPWSLAGGDAEAPAGIDSTGGPVLRGLAGSPGKVTASCFLVHSPDDFGKFPPGAILVARTTNPAWTPLFYGASGLITESGGPLSHGAVTAREMKLPAVMSVRGAMTRLKDGMSVTVDGTKGTVTFTVP